MTSTADPVVAALLVCSLTVLGLVFGSFLTVIVERVPKSESLMTRSACPSCGHHVRAWHNIPVAGWLLLRGRCADCRTRIPARYPLLELVTGSAWACVGVWLLANPGQGPVAVLLVAAVTVAIGLAIIDWRLHRLPDELTGFLAAFIVVWALVTGVSGLMSWSALGTATASAALWAGLFAVPWFVTAGAGMGFGDVKLAPSVGFVLGVNGWAASLTGWFAGFVLALLFAAAVRMRPTLAGPSMADMPGRASQAGSMRKMAVPYGPFMLAGAGAGWVLGPAVASVYLSLFGF